MLEAMLDNGTNLVLSGICWSTLESFCTAVAWGGANAPWATGCHLFATPENFLAIFYCCFIFVAMKKSPNILVEVNLGLCNIQGNSIFSRIHLIHFILVA